jgi:ABC-type polysaccharide/polyol phosphate transport system ATPase subunit
MSLVISVEGVWKGYPLEQVRTRNHLIGSGSIPLVAETPEQGLVWSLQDISFEVAQGQAVGILGHNGAGKSTLLKLLSGLTRPTKGRISIRGRLVSILEMGAGFQPDLSVYDNIVANALLIGFSYQSVRQKMEEILDFAELNEHVGKPVKYLSSGMQMRLALAIFVTLDTDILLLDEALAAGDYRFREKALTRVRQLVAQGKTAVIVSHDVRELSKVATQALALKNGCLTRSGSFTEVKDWYLADQYMASLQRASAHSGEDFSFPLLSPFFQVHHYAVWQGGTYQASIDFDLPFEVQVVFYFTEPFTRSLSFTIGDLSDHKLSIASQYYHDTPPAYPVGQLCRLTIRYPARYLCPGFYLFNFFVNEPADLYHVVWHLPYSLKVRVSTPARFEDAFFTHLGTYSINTEPWDIQLIRTI